MHVTVRSRGTAVPATLTFEPMDQYLRDDLAAKGLDVQKLDETSRLGVLHVCVNHLCLNELAWLDCRKILLLYSLVVICLLCVHVGTLSSNVSCIFFFICVLI